MMASPKVREKGIAVISEALDLNFGSKPTSHTRLARQIFDMLDQAIIQKDIPTEADVKKRMREILAEETEAYFDTQSGRIRAREIREGEFTHERAITLNAMRRAFEERTSL